MGVQKGRGRQPPDTTGAHAQDCEQDRSRPAVHGVRRGAHVARGRARERIGASDSGLADEDVADDVQGDCGGVGVEEDL